MHKHISWPLLLPSSAASSAQPVLLHAAWAAMPTWGGDADAKAIVAKVCELICLCSCGNGKDACRKVQGKPADDKRKQQQGRT